MKTVLTIILICLFFSICNAQPSRKGEGLDLVLQSKNFGFAQLRGTMDENHLPDTLYSSVITIEGTTNNYIRSLPAGAHGYFATIGSDISLKQAKALVEQWKLVVEKIAKREGISTKKSKIAPIAHLGYLFMPTGESNFQIFIAYHKMEGSQKYEADISLMTVPTIKQTKSP
jgi:hypothetical protein